MGTTLGPVASVPPLPHLQHSYLGLAFAQIGGGDIAPTVPYCLFFLLHLQRVSCRIPGPLSGGEPGAHELPDGAHLRGEPAAEDAGRELREGAKCFFSAHTR